jgi:hypothetical protein
MKFASEGEKVTCENGHFICEVAADLYKQQRGPLAEQFRNWQQAEPKNGDPIRPCEVCGAAYLIVNGIGGARLHTERGWVS